LPSGGLAVEYIKRVIENTVFHITEAGTNRKRRKTAAFTVPDKVNDRKQGTGAVICACPQPGMLRENILQIPVWYI